MNASTRLLLVPAFSLVSATVLVAQPPAGDSQRRQLSIEVLVQGEESWQHNGSWEKGQIRQRFAVTTTLHSDGGRSAVNPLDPRSAAAAPQLMVPPPGIGMVQGVDLSALAGVAEADEIYQPWLGEDGCPGSFIAHRDDASQGQLADVGAPRARQARVQLDESGARAGLCHQYAMTVVDTRAQRLFLESFALPALRARRSSTGVQGEQTVEAMQPEIRQWVNAQLRGLPLSGQRSATLDLTQPIVVVPTKHYAGRATVTLKWRFA